MHKIIKTIIMIIIIQYLIVIIFLSNYLFDKTDIKTYNEKNNKLKFINNIFENQSMYSLIYKYQDKFIKNKFSCKDKELIKLNEFINDNSYNYFAIGQKIIIYFYKKNNKHYINVSYFFMDDLKKNTFKIIKYCNHIDIVKILTIYKYNSLFNIYKYSDNKFELVEKNKKIEETIDIVYNLEYKHNSNNNKIILYGACLGGNIVNKLCKYIKSKYNINIKLITFETHFYENPNITNNVTIYTYNSLFYWFSKISGNKINYVFKIKIQDILKYIFSTLFFSLFNYCDYHHCKYFIQLRKSNNKKIEN